MSSTGMMQNGLASFLLLHSCRRPNSCFPDNISSYAAPPCALPSLSEDQIQTAVSSLHHTVAVDSALKLYDQLDNLSAARFANCRLHLPCIVHRVTEVRRRQDLAQETQFTDAGSVLMGEAHPTGILLVRPWDRRLFELPDFAELPAFDDDAVNLSDPGSPLDRSHDSSKQEWIDSECRSRALRLIVRLRQPFSAFLLAQQRGGEYKRIASDRDIIAQIKDTDSVHNMMDIRTLEIL
ncbi:hypothetical protein EDD22DRAFT_959792 [Suillus occidentalis]|nr:hypothetical protein EDD22DRAFT_959792 [Suillus occidentalis]